MTYLFARYPHLRRLPKAFGRSLRQALGLLAIIFMAACGTKDAAPSGNDNRLELQDLPGQAVSQTGTKPTPAEVDARELQYHSNRWSEVKPEMRAYIDIHRSGSTPRSVTPGSGDSAATAAKSTTNAAAEKIAINKSTVAKKTASATNTKDSTSSAANVASVGAVKDGIETNSKPQLKTAPSQTKQEKSTVAAKLKRELADIEEPDSLPQTGKSKQRLSEAERKKSVVAPSEDEGSEIDLSEPILADGRPVPSVSAHATRETDEQLQKAIEETNRRAMLSSPGGSIGQGNAENTNEPKGQDDSAEGRAKLEKAAAGQGFGFAPLFSVLAAALILILAIKRARRAKPPIDPNKTN